MVAKINDALVPTSFSATRELAKGSNALSENVLSPEEVAIAQENALTPEPVQVACLEDACVLEAAAAMAAARAAVTYGGPLAIAAWAALRNRPSFSPANSDKHVLRSTPSTVDKAPLVSASVNGSDDSREGTRVPHEIHPGSLDWEQGGEYLHDWNQVPEISWEDVVGRDFSPDYSPEVPRSKDDVATDSEDTPKSLVELDNERRLGDAKERLRRVETPLRQWTDASLDAAARAQVAQDAEDDAAQSGADDRRIRGLDNNGSSGE